jgi:hypothetical protein
LCGGIYRLGAVLKLDENARKLEKMDDRQRAIEMVNVKMSAMLEKHDKTIDEHDERIDNLEGRGAKEYDKIRMILISAVIGAVVMALIETFLK